ncbi:MAG: tandem-95 repeat protein [Frankiaceae bacterium]|nr:tandem-95 repeat protein [Frankiaceae bacterium]
MIRRGWGLLGLVLALVAATLVVAAGPSAADQNEGITPALVDAQRLMAVGGRHTCAVMDTGLVRCWGDNANGQLGNGTRAVSNEPKPVPTITTAVAVTAGNTHTCALLKTATVMCWGLNSNGQIGADSVLVNSSDTPRAVPGLADVRAIAAGGFHNCALLDTGHVKCWGLDGVGQLGDGAGTPLGEAFTPVEVTGIDNATAIAAGEFHTCARLATGGMKCWGHNGFGQLGNDSDIDSTTPVAVSGLPDGNKKALAITTGYGHTCAVIDDDDADEDKNTIRCWGNNTQGQLGDGTTTDRKTPVPVKYDKNGYHANASYDYADFFGADVVSAGQYHTCARTVAGGAWCWGNAGRGQIGNGTKGEVDVYPGVDEKQKFMWRSAKPVAIDPVSAITAGGFHTCALLGTQMQCWGYNFYGQLGSYLDESFVPVTVTALQGAESVATGTDAACARVQVPGTPDTHQPVCWGTNAHGELGANVTPAPTSNSTVPVKVFNLADVSTLAAGNGHTCTLPTGSTSPLCWGNNDDGQLGNATSTDSNVPVAVSALTTATQLSAGGRALGGVEIAHTCARLHDGTARCWGRNGDGQLGNNATSTSPTTASVVVLYDADPAPPDPSVPDDHFDPQPLTGVVQVAAGGSHSCALRTDTTVWCWGRNANGQLGDNTTTGRHLATQVKLVDDPDDDPPDTYLTGVKAVTAGERHTCALMAGAEDGKVRCWGANNLGQLGDGTTGERHLPKLILTIPQGSGVTRNPLAVALTAGTSHTCAIMDNASARCWGDNSAGQLGDGSGGPGSFSANPVTPVGLDNDTADTIRDKLPDDQPDDLVTSLSAGRRNTCASLIDMTVSCWGSNSSGQLGDGVGPTRKTPIEVKHLDEGINGNRSPAASDDTAGTVEDTQVSVNVTANDSDPDGNSISVLQVKDPAHGSASGSGATVTYTPDPNYCGSDAVSYRIFDGRNGIADAVIAVTISCVNDPPVAVDDTVTTPEDAAVEVPVLDNDHDPDAGDALSVLSVDQPTHGSTSLASGVVTYTPATDYNGPDSFTYVVQDDNVPSDSDSGTVAVTVTAGNDPPLAVDDTASTTEDAAVTVPVLDNDSDIDLDTLTVSSVTQPSHGSAVVVPGGVKYTPTADYNGPDTFTYVADDGHGGTDSATVPLTVSPVNDAPIVRDDTAATQQGVVVTVPVLDNDSDADGDVLTVSSATQPNHGSTVFGPSGVTYTPAAGYSGPDSFSYVATDGHSGTGSALVSVTVAPGNYPPSAGDDTATTAEDSPVSVPVLANDFDPEGAALTVSSVTQPSHGSTSIVGGAVKYTPATNFWGTDSFTYVVSDPSGGTDTAAVAMTVTAVSDPPKAVDDAASTPEDVAVTVPVLSNDSDPDGDVVTVSSVTQPSHGSVSVVSGGVRYTPASNYSEGDSFTYAVTDGHGGSASATVSLTVSPVNDPPTLDPIGDRSTPWGSPVEVVATGHDVEGDPLTYSLVSGPAGASVDWWGSIAWTPQASDVGAHTITVRVSDGSASADRSFKVTVTRQATTITYSGVTSGQYSDEAWLVAELTTSAGAPVGGAAVAFTVAGRSANAATSADGTASGYAVLTSAPGSSSVVASFAGSPAYEPASVSTPFTVTPEDATVTITGPGLVVTSSAAASTQLSALVQEASDSSAGTALGSAQVQFTDVAGTTLCTATVTSSGAGSGTAVCTTGALAAGSRGFVAKLLSTSYVAGVDVAAFSVASVPTGSAAGGGSVADGTGQRTDFAFRANPAKKGVTGDAVQVFRQQADLGYGNRSYAFVVSTGSVSSLSRTCTAKAPKVCSATVQGDNGSTRAVDLATGTVLAVSGTATLRIDATDKAEPSGGATPPDLFAVSIVGPRSFSVGSPTDQRLLTGGNVRIPA